MLIKILSDITQCLDIKVEVSRHGVECRDIEKLMLLHGVECRDIEKLMSRLWETFGADVATLF